MDTEQRIATLESIVEQLMRDKAMSPNENAGCVGPEIYTIPVLGDDGDAPRPKAFDIEGGMIVRCQILVGNVVCTCGNYALGSDETAYLVVSVSNGDYNISISSTPQQRTVTSFSVPLYINGIDYRPGSIAAFAL